MPRKLLTNNPSTRFVYWRPHELQSKPEDVPKNKRNAITPIMDMSGNVKYYLDGCQVVSRNYFYKNRKHSMIIEGKERTVTKDQLYREHKEQLQRQRNNAHDPMHASEENPEDSFIAVKKVIIPDRQSYYVFESPPYGFVEEKDLLNIKYGRPSFDRPLGFYLDKDGQRIPLITFRGLAKRLFFVKGSLTQQLEKIQSSRIDFNARGACLYDGIEVDIYTKKTLQEAKEKLMSITLPIAPRVAIPQQNVIYYHQATLFYQPVNGTTQPTILNNVAINTQTNCSNWLIKEEPEKLLSQNHLPFFNPPVNTCQEITHESEDEQEIWLRAIFN